MITPMTRPSTVDIALTVAAPNRQPRVQAAAITNMPEPVVKAQTYRKTSERCKAGGKSEDSAIYAAYLIYRSNELTAIQRLYDLAVVMCTYFVRVINAEPADNRNYCNCDQRHP